LLNTILLFGGCQKEKTAVVVLPEDKKNTHASKKADPKDRLFFLIKQKKYIAQLANISIIPMLSLLL